MTGAAFLAQRVGGTAAIFMLAACGSTAPPPAPAPGAALALLDRPALYALHAPPALRLASGYFDRGIVGIEDGGDGVLHVATPPGNALFGRRFGLPLTAFPILHWTWRTAGPVAGASLADDAAMRLVIGFSGGAPFALGSISALPPHDRALLVVWSKDEWEAGVADRRGPYARYVAHGGGIGGEWWKQSLNLAELHGQLWPSVPLARVTLEFVAVATRGTHESWTGDVAGISLSAELAPAIAMTHDDAPRQSRSDTFQ